MAAPANTVTTLTTIGQREDLEDTIYRVAPEDTPFISAIGKKKAKGRYHEWQTETLATPDPTNAALEGDDAANAAGNQPTRVGNYCQIFTKSFGVARTAEVVDKAGRKSEVARQKVIKGLELRRDMEARYLGNFASNNESGSTPRRSAGILAFITSNDSRGSGGSDGGFSAGVVAAATNGTQRQFTEALLKSVMATGFSNGARPSQIYMGGTHKQQFSGFTGIADIRAEVKGREQATIVAGADLYVSDFGTLAAIPVQYGLTRDAVLVDPKKASVATLDGFATTPLGKTGDSDKFLMTHEACLVVENEKAHEVIADLN